MKISKHFDHNEFKCKCGQAHDFHMYDGLIYILEELRNYYESPVIITSGYRCPTHNDNVGGAKNSFHMKGMAADVKVKGVNPKDVYKHLCEVYDSHCGLGFIEYKTFVHIDVRENPYRKGL